MRPRIHNLKIVAAIAEVRSSSDNGYVPDSKMVVVAEVRSEMSVVDAANFLPMFHMFVVPFLLPGFVVVLFLGECSQRSSH
jgi:hypothetical protein